MFESPADEIISSFLPGSTAISLRSVCEASRNFPCLKVDLFHPDRDDGRSSRFLNNLHNHLQRNPSYHLSVTKVSLAYGYMIREALEASVRGFDMWDSDCSDVSDDLWPLAEDNDKKCRLRINAFLGCVKDVKQFSLDVFLGGKNSMIDFQKFYSNNKNLQRIRFKLDWETSGDTLDKEDLITLIPQISLPKLVYFNIDPVADIYEYDFSDLSPQNFPALQNFGSFACMHNFSSDVLGSLFENTNINDFDPGNGNKSGRRLLEVAFQRKCYEITLNVTNLIALHAENISSGISILNISINPFDSIGEYKMRDGMMQHLGLDIDWRDDREKRRIVSERISSELKNFDLVSHFANIIEKLKSDLQVIRFERYGGGWCNYALSDYSGLTLFSRLVDMVLKVCPNVAIDIKIGILRELSGHQEYTDEYTNQMQQFYSKYRKYMSMKDFFLTGSSV